MNIKTNLLSTIMLLFCVAALSSCSAIEGIFKAGVWFGVIGIAIVVFIILYFIGKSKK